MRAVRAITLDGPRSLELADIEPPVAGPDGVLIDVEATGVAWPDLLQTRGRYQARPALPYVPGFEAAGRVRSAPAGSGLAVGQRVAAFTGGGAWQERIAVSPADVFAIPEAMSAAAAAGTFLNYLTVHFALRRRTPLVPGEDVVVHGATGGIGEASLVLARAWGARTIAVVSTETKAAAARRTGAHDVVHADGFLPAVKELTGGKGADVVIDPVGGDRFTDSLRSLAPEGRILVIGFTGGEIPTVKVNRLLLGNLSVVGVAWAEFVARHPGYMRRQWEDLLPALASGEVVVPEAATYPLDRAADVLEAMDDRRLIGKAVLVP